MMDYPAAFLEQQLVTSNLSPIVDNHPKEAFTFVDVLEVSNN